MKLVVTMMLTLSQESTIDNVRVLRAALARAAYPSLGVTSVDEILTTLEVEAKPTLRPLAKTALAEHPARPYLESNAPPTITEQMQASVTFLKAVKETGLEETKARQFLAALSKNHASLLVEDAQRSTRKQ